MKPIFFVIIFVLLLVSGCSSSDIQREVMKELEKAYFEGQKDAISGDVRIRKDIDGDWTWSKSPWNDDEDGKHPPIFNPKFDYYCGKDKTK